MKLSWLNTFLWFLQKHTFLECQIFVMSSHNPSRDFFCLCWAFPQINLVKLLVLGLSFYNFKSFKHNKSASLFRKRKNRFLAILKAFLKAFYLVQWLDPLLAALYFKIFFLTAKTSLLALPPPRAITPQPYYMPPPLLLLYRLSLLSLLWPNTWKIIFNRFSRPFWILDLLLLFWLLHQLLINTKALLRGLWRPSSQMSIRVKLIWSNITSFSNVRTILLPPELRVKIGYHLLPLFLKI